MAAVNRNKHLTLDERKIIEQGIDHGATKTAIAITIGKDNSTVGKEIALHRIRTYVCKLPLECKGYRTCSHGRHCRQTCPDYVPFICQRRDRSPGACNGCQTLRNCRYTKFTYRAAEAQLRYEHVLVQARSGLDLNEEDVERLAAVIVPAIRQGQSPYHIAQNHPELGCCEKTIYNYVAGGVFRKWHVLDIDLRQKTKRKLPKKKALMYKKREDRSFLKNRLHQDYLRVKEAQPELQVVQMDTIYNEQTGPFIQTFKFLTFDFLFALFHDTKTTRDMTNGVNMLEAIIGEDAFEEHVPLLLTDRGTEFSAAEDMETRDDQTKRTRVFYCDPMASGQKGSLEKRHAELRYILPKACSLRTLGLTDQTKLNLVLSHVNSVPHQKHHGKTPFQLLRFYCPHLVQAFQQFGIEEIPKDKVILKPYLLK